jgi:membrane-associated protease RseP (regulator of RpoE activity)
VSSTLAIIAFFGGLLIIILIHELGHYTVARHYGFKVLEYFVGFGPRLWSTRRGEIEYGVKALPLGGYVKIAGMNPYEPVAPEDLPRSYGEKPIWQRALVIFAGPGSHFIVAALLFACALFFFGDPRTPLPVSVVGTVDPTLNGEPSPAYVEGLQNGDTIVRVGDVADPSADQLRAVLSSHVTPTPSPVTVTIRRGDETFDVNITPVAVPDPQNPKQEIGRIGVELSPVYAQPGVLGSLVGGIKLVGDTITGSIRQIGQVFGPHGVNRIGQLLFTNAQRTTSDPTTVVGIGQQVGQTGAAGDWGDILFMLAYVTVFIGLVNLLPLPPFDGGHLAVLLIEKVRGNAVDMRKLIPVSAVVMAFLVVFVVANAYLDITKPIPSP